jgi:hypothetical protein
MRKLKVVALSLGSLLAVGPASAQDAAPAVPAETHPQRGRAVGLGVAVGSGGMDVSGSSSSTLAVGIVARVGLDSRNRFQLIGEYSPTKVDSPIADESFTSANILLGYTFGTGFKVRPVVGAQVRWWTGSQRVTASDWGLVLGVDAGPELHVGDRVSLSPELVLRLSVIEVEGSVSSRLIGAQCVVSWRS